MSRAGAWSGAEATPADPSVSVHLRIDHLAVEIGEEHRAEDLEETLRTALALLASRLANAPYDAGRDGPTLALELLEIEPRSADWLAGPGAADRLADELLARIWGAAR
jgi:hypothetical protein